MQFLLQFSLLENYFEINPLSNVISAFFIFCTLSSSVYIINDIFDREKDRMHPFKKFRPLAHDDVPLVFAIIVTILLILISFIWGSTINSTFMLSIFIYLLLQILYSALLKHIAIIDILALASGYIIRVYAGEFASGLHISVWLLLTTISLSLFLAIGKRRSELTLASRYSDLQISKMRKSLSRYSEPLLNVYASIFATSTFISYSLFTFLESQGRFKASLEVLMPEFLPEIFQKKWLMITILPVVYGIMRYLQDIYEKNEGESPEKVLLSDIPLIITIFIWFFLVILSLYVIG